MISRRLLRLTVAAGSGLILWLAWSGYRYWRDNYATISFPKIDRRVEAANWRPRPLIALPRFNPKSTHPFQVDLRSQDLTRQHLQGSGPDLKWATFDDATRWPAAGQLPPSADFDPVRIMALGRNPGLGLRALHAQGITGRGVGIAIIDHILPTGHPEYADRLRLYEEADDLYWPFNDPDLHGAAVASFALGKTIGVAPEADLFFVASHLGYTSLRGLWERFVVKSKVPPADFHVLARAVRRILRLNVQLPPGRKIRVLAMAIGWEPRERGYDDIAAAAAEARAAGLLVICSSVEAVHGFKFHGLGRAPLADPDAFESYGPGQWWEARFARDPAVIKDRLLVPMDSRTSAGYVRTAPYVFYRQGGWSWAIPYIAGAYALAAQVKPAITPDEFWRVALATGRTINLQHEGHAQPFGPILDPAALVRALQPPEAARPQPGSGP
jgi:hypothetical protein